VNQFDPLGTFSLSETLLVVGKILSIVAKITTVITVAVYGYRAGGIIFKLSTGEQRLVDEAFLEAEDLAVEIGIDIAIIVATFGIGKLLKAAGHLFKGGRRLSALARLNRNVKYGRKAEKYILGSVKGKKAFTTTLGKVVPDRVTSHTIKEVKNVKYLTKSKQMRKMVQLAHGGQKAGGQPARKLILHVRPNTNISGPLSEAFDDLAAKGLFELKTDIPMSMAP